MTYFKIEKIFLGWLALSVAQIIAGTVIRVHAPMPAHAFEWMLVTNFLVAAVLGMIAVRSDWAGWKLSAALVAIPFVINFVNMIEGRVFMGNSGIPWRSLMFHLLLTYILVLPLWRYIFGQGQVAPAHVSPLRDKSLGGIAWRFVISDFLYLSLYFVAGMIIFPFVKAFYATQTLPPARTIVALQLLLRGPVFVFICMLLARMIGLSRWAGALAVGFAFTMLSGVAPLLMPNPYFPDAVRWVHFAEVTSSNFAFGTLVGLLWAKSRSALAPRTMHQAA